MSDEDDEDEDDQEEDDFYDLDDFDSDDFDTDDLDSDFEDEEGSDMTKEQAAFQAAYPDGLPPVDEKTGDFVFGKARTETEDDDGYGADAFPNSPQMTGSHAVRTTSGSVGQGKRETKATWTQRDLYTNPKSAGLYAGGPVQVQNEDVQEGQFKNSPQMIGPNRNKRSAELAAARARYDDAHDPDTYNGTKPPAPPSPFAEPMPRGLRKQIEANNASADMRERGRKRR